MPEKLNIIIRNAFIIDGLGSAGWHGDIGIKGDRIERVDSQISQSAYIELDARGHAVSPGFIDTHTHDDLAVIQKPEHLCKLSQGVTTVIVGNCGISIAPVTINQPPPAPMNIVSQEAFYPTYEAYFEAIKEAQPSVNVVAQVGHSALRLMAMGHDYNRPATRDEIIAMGTLLIEAFNQGAAGFSTGLEYPLARASLAEEIVAMTQLTHEFGGFYTSHMRDEGEGVLKSIEETASAGKLGRVPVVISHHKLSGLKMHGKSIDTLAAIDDAARTQTIHMDAYPYIASSTMLDAKRVKHASRTIIAWSKPFPDMTGKDFSEFQTEYNLSVEEAVEQLSPAGGIYFNMNEEDVRRILAHPLTMIGSDGLPHDTHPHPRLWGTFPKVLGHYARDVGILSLEQAVHKMTGLSAKTFGLTDRGLIQEGAFADLVMFDPKTIADKATFENPTLPAVGIDAVWVNGVMSYSRGRATDLRAGRVLKRKDLRRLTFGAYSK